MQLIKLTEILGDCNADSQITSPVMVNPDAIAAVSINETGDTMVHMGPTPATNFIVTESFTEVQELVKGVSNSGVSPVPTEPMTYWMVCLNSNGKYFDGFFGADANITTPDQIFAAEEAPYKVGQMCINIVVGCGPEKPGVSEVQKLLKSYNLP